MSKTLTRALDTIRPVLKAVVAAALSATTTWLITGAFDWRVIAGAAIAAAGVWIVPNISPSTPAVPPPAPVAVVPAPTSTPVAKP